MRVVELIFEPAEGSLALDGPGQPAPGPLIGNSLGEVRYTSEVFYDWKLHGVDGLSRQEILGEVPFTGSGLRMGGGTAPGQHERVAGRCRRGVVAGAEARGLFVARRGWCGAAGRPRRHPDRDPIQHAEPGQVRHARAALAGWLRGCPQADEAILIASEFFFPGFGSVSPKFAPTTRPNCRRRHRSQVTHPILALLAT